MQGLSKVPWATPEEEKKGKKKEKVKKEKKKKKGKKEKKGKEKKEKKETKHGLWISEEAWAAAEGGYI